MFWNALTGLALEFVHADPRYREVTIADLQTWILNTGYEGAQEAHQSTRQLIYAYAASLRNGNGLGPAFAPFAQMVVTAIDPFIVNNALARAPSLVELARACRAYLLLPVNSGVLVSEKVNYREDLRRLENGEGVGRKNAKIEQCLRSVVGFTEFLYRNYGGSAPEYHERFAEHYDGERPNRFIVDCFIELGRLPQVGVAIGMNFFKDTQSNAYRGSSLQDLRTSHAGWFVKPDMHVLRLMLHVSGRSSRLSDRATVNNMADGKAAKLYFELNPLEAGVEYTLDSSAADRADRGKWRCIEDVHRLAIAEQVPPLAIDRLLYMIGSGRFLHPAKKISNEHHYRRFMAVVDTWRAQQLAAAAAVVAAGQPSTVCRASYD
jgi:hypothetical protein